MNECPKCGGEIWSNIAKNKERVEQGLKPMPEYSCKDKEGCGWVKWPEKKEGFKRPVKNEGQIIRQHSQEMALRYCEAKGKKDFDLKQLAALIGWFEADAIGTKKVEPKQPEEEMEDRNDDSAKHEMKLDDDINLEDLPF